MDDQESDPFVEYTLNECSLFIEDTLSESDPFIEYTLNEYNPFIEDTPSSDPNMNDSDQNDLSSSNSSPHVTIAKSKPLIADSSQQTGLINNIDREVVNLTGEDQNLGNNPELNFEGTPSSDPNMNDSDQTDLSSSNSSPQVTIDESKPLNANSSQQLPSTNFFPFPANFYFYYKPMYPQYNLSGLPPSISGYCAPNDYIPPDFTKFKEFLQYKISGDRKKSFKKEKLHALYKIFQEKFQWEKLTRKDKRNKDLVFKKLFRYKDIVKYSIQTCPEVFLYPVLVKDLPIQN